MSKQALRRQYRDIQKQKAQTRRDTLDSISGSFMDGTSNKYIKTPSGKAKRTVDKVLLEESSTTLNTPEDIDFENNTESIDEEETQERWLEEYEEYEAWGAKFRVITIQALVNRAAERVARFFL